MGTIAKLEEQYSRLNDATSRFESIAKREGIYVGFNDYYDDEFLNEIYIIEDYFVLVRTFFNGPVADWIVLKDADSVYNKIIKNIMEDDEFNPNNSLSAQEIEEIELAKVYLEMRLNDG